MAGSVRVLVSTAWLARQLVAKNSTVKVIDASFNMPAWNRDALQEYEASHIPTATFFDVDKIKDETSDLPHMLPPANVFQEAMRDRGIYNNDHVVIYDCSDFGIFSAPRLWWMFRMFGHDRVSVLNGGFTAWTKEERPVESAPLKLPVEPRSDYVVQDEKTELVRTRQDVLDNLAHKKEHVLDARSRESWNTPIHSHTNIHTHTHLHMPTLMHCAAVCARFNGTAPEPRPGLSSGHVPGSTCLPFTDFLADKRMKERGELETIFKVADTDLQSRRCIASCGSGVSACVIAMAAHIVTAPLDPEGGALNHDQVMPIYDGAWTEWASSGCPIEKHQDAQ
ncbi:hypothetical protein PTSG_11787 [Salpingoeca rosetta]|uniref:Rhodanese domain-containing protein n=1 Tax=Salpingoeca rosetta (strain ATCC 50818 / BSB-021) TaxID=946362 RepID=F2TZ40_SALR5|nr:uncharacterized protein PTSG_11787 [Salpingoeca rosetta]EGD78865.1 hypothetical protein PTSG_11787 [Salpingoeca rosetta]|eukprot:XP_004997821.1 hypothetical protein PTSG_11787 [Salpingoeca rosetta]